MAWLTGWTYRKSITISRAEGAVSDYQVKILVGESAGAAGEAVDCGGNVASDFDDLRFTTSDGITLLDYWIEKLSGSTPNQLATVWVEFDSIGTTDTTFFMYYGNAGAAAYSNGANTFLLFDHFDDSSVGAIWTANGTPTEAGTLLTLNAASEGIKSVDTYQYKRWRSNLKFLPYNDANYRNWAGFKTNFNQVAEETAHVVPVGAATTQMYRQTYFDAWESVNDGGGFTNVYVTFQIDRFSDAVDFYYDDVLKGSHTTEVPTASLPAWFMCGVGTNYKTSFTVDWVFVANLSDPEPSISAYGDEQENAADSTYPVSLDDAPTDRAQGDVVPSSDLNKYFDAAVFLENTVGITGSAVTTSLNYILTNAASLNPGHMHRNLYDSAGSTVCMSGGATGEQLQVGGVTYTWPSTQTATGCALQTTIAGVLSWGAQIKVRLFANTAHSVGTGAWHILLCDGRSFDTAGVSDIATNKGRITPGIAGYYMVGGTTHADLINAGQQWISSIYVNGAEVLRGTRGDPGAGANLGSSVAGIVKLTSTDYVEMYVYNGDSGSISWLAGTTVSYVWLWGPL